MKAEVLASILASTYKKEILLILGDGHLETPKRILKKLQEKGLKSANKQNVSLNLTWLRLHGLIKIEVDRPKGKLYKITEEGKEYVRKIKE
jgi:DNA-binding PadR family transcriptional regulator